METSSLTFYELFYLYLHLSDKLCDTLNSQGCEITSLKMITEVTHIVHELYSSYKPYKKDK